MAEKEEYDALELFDHLAAYGPAALIMFLILDVRNKNLTGKRLAGGLLSGKDTSTDEVSSGGTNQVTKEPQGWNPPPVSNCDWATINSYYQNYLMGCNYANIAAAKEYDWVREHYPGCEEQFK